MTAMQKAIAEMTAEDAVYWEHNEAVIARECPADLYDGLMYTRHEVAAGRLPRITGEELVQMYHDGYPVLFLVHLTDPLPEQMAHRKPTHEIADRCFVDCYHREHGCKAKGRQDCEHCKIYVHKLDAGKPWARHLVEGAKDVYLG